MSDPITNVADLRAISIRRPWANLIIAGAKDIENRGWRTNYRGPLVIAAGTIFETPGAVAARAVGLDNYSSKDGCPQGYLGVVDLCEVHPATGRCCNSIWAQPPMAGQKVYHWTVSHPRRFREIITGPGQLSLYTPPPAVFAELERSMPDLLPRKDFG